MRELPGSGWEGEGGSWGILVKPGACLGQAGAQDSAERPPEVTLFPGQCSWAILQGQSGYPMDHREPARPRVTAQSTR